MAHHSVVWREKTHLSLDRAHFYTWRAHVHLKGFVQKALISDYFQYTPFWRSLGVLCSWFMRVWSGQSLYIAMVTPCAVLRCKLIALIMNGLVLCIFAALIMHHELSLRSINISWHQKKQNTLKAMCQNTLGKKWELSFHFWVWVSLKPRHRHPLADRMAHVEP